MQFMRIMRRNYRFLLLALLLAFASCSFTSKKFEENDKDKLLIQLITYVIGEGHFDPKDIDDTFSANVFEDYLDQLDPLKRYFYASDIKEFEKYKNEIDDQLKAYDITFFNITHERLLKRIAEAEELYKDILSKPFNFSKDETFSTDYENLTYVKSKKEMRERWRQQLKFSTIANYDDAIESQEMAKENAAQNEGEFQEYKSKTEIEEEARSKTLNSLEELHSYIDDRQRKDWFAVFINAVVMEFDPHTFYMAPEDKERFDAAMAGNFEGIGARLQKKIDAIMVMEVISGGPAWRANELEVGDQIMKVRQENEETAVNVVGMRLDDAIKLIKGPKGTDVILTLKRADGTIEDITITRDVVILEETYAKSSKVEKEGKTFGLINLPRFYVDFENYNERNAASDIKKEVERLKAEGMEGLVLDLRNNGGGSLQVVVDIVGLFIEDGPVVQVKTTGEPKEVLKDTDKSIIWDGPLVILVNDLSASASEILAAAVQDYKRGIIIGSEQTYGKGTVQTFFPLNRLVRNNSNGDLGSLKFTIQKYYRINGGSVQLEGVKSDVVMPHRFSYLQRGEKDYDNPLSWDEIDATNYSVWDNYFDYEGAIENSRNRMANSEQFKLIEASAKWMKKIRERESFSLNYDKYKAEIQLSEEEAKQFDKIADYKTNLSFQSLPYELKAMEQDSVLKEKRKRWHESLSKDVYVEEALNVLNDLKLSYQINKTKVAVKN